MIDAATIDRLLKTIDRFVGKRVLVIGDVMVDEYLRGSVERISPEAPVPVVALQTRTSQPGGAANVALNAKTLGAEVRLLGLRGDDPAGETLLRALEDNGLSGADLVTSSTRRTTRKTRILSGGQQLLRVDTEDAEPTTIDERGALWQLVQGLLDAWQPEVIIFEDYDKGVLGEWLIKQVVEAATARNIPTVVDPKARNFWCYRGVTIFKPNLKEVSEALPELSEHAELTGQLAGAHTALRNRLHHQYSLITLGAKGAYLAEADFTQHIPAHHRDIADVCGAGDSVVATIALAHVSGALASDLLALANLAGGLACEHTGVRPVRATELRSGVTDLA